MDPTVCMFFDRFLKILIILCYIKKMLFPLFFRNHSEAKDVSLGIWLTKNKTVRLCRDANLNRSLLLKNQMMLALSRIM